ncbi:HD-GYP domain-containing protein [Fervidobacterium sp.]
MANNQNVKKTIYKWFQNTKYLILILFILSILGVIRIAELGYDTTTEYFQIKETFKEINQAVLDHSKVINLFDDMQKYGYDSRQITEALSKADSSTVDSQLRIFAEHMRNVEAELIRFSYRYFLSMISIIVLGLLLLFFSYYRTLKLARSLFQKILDSFRKVLEKMYIGKAELVGKVEFREEEVINELINEAILRNDLINYFNNLPYVDTIEDYINFVGEQVCSFFEAGRFSLALISGDEVIAEVAYFAEPGHITLLGKGFKQKLTETSLGKMIENETKFQIIGDLRERKNSESSQLIIKEGFLSNLTVPAIVNGRTIGFFFLSSEELNHFTEEDGLLFYLISLILSPKLYHTLSVQNIISNFGNSLVNLAEYRDNETGNHIKRVALYSRTLAEALGLEPKLVREIYQFAPLHDIGKIGIPDRILLKPGKLDENEWEIMKNHVIIGMRILQEFAANSNEWISEEVLRTAINIVSDHHEKWDGSGYPFGKKEEEISIEGRIVAVADVFDALTTERPYKKAFPFDESVKIIEEQAGRHFDPEIVRVFMEKLDVIRMIHDELKDVRPEDICDLAEKD